jgi:hypothetical protein
MLRRTRFSVCFETALLCLVISFHVLNSLVYRLDQTGAAQALQAKSLKAPLTSHFEAEIKAEGDGVWMHTKST